MELEVPVIFLEVTITTVTIDQEADLVIVEKEVPNLNGGHLQIRIINLIITITEVKITFSNVMLNLSWVING